jgi:hypothetical protein
MKINLWKCEEMNEWRWTLVKTDRPILQQKSGSQKTLHDAMKSIENAVEEFVRKC